ncbi:MAG: hypothetical protein WEB06_04440 [Actinomycetota bacterium]
MNLLNLLPRIDVPSLGGTSTGAPVPGGVRGLLSGALGWIL